ncbi:MAG: methyltransferase domain-containing protein [Prochloraceae cyanobacterium]|nr:methyltransferase domain-containing protein [Prochloraceae cyanobacterium]
MTIESNTPEIDIDDVKKIILKEIDRHKLYRSQDKIVGIKNYNNDSSINYIETLLKNAEVYSDTPTQWPEKLNFFIFANKKIQNFILKLYGFIFKKQREVNNSLITSLRFFFKQNQQFIQYIQKRFMATEENLFNKFTTLEETFLALNTELKNEMAEIIKENNYLKKELAQQKRSLAMFVEEAKKRLPEPFDRQQLKTFLNEGSHLLDAFYVEFEDNFRGSREEIRDRQKIYLPFLSELKKDLQNSLIIDIGCGRGEWLELLKEVGYKSKGIDLNRLMVEQCCSRGLDVIEGDAISYLRSLPDASIGAITGFHIIEHLPFKVLLQLFHEALRVLQPGGVVIFETPNPENVLVGSCKFYLDPSHLNPLPSQTIEFLAKSQGLHSVKIINLNPVPKNSRLQGSDSIEAVDRYFYGAQDYAMIGYKI